MIDRLPAPGTRFRAGTVPGRPRSAFPGGCRGCGLPTAGRVPRWTWDRGWDGLPPVPMCGWCADLETARGTLEVADPAGAEADALAHDPRTAEVLASVVARGDPR